MKYPGWVPPPLWSVPREWDASEPCFVLCGGESVKKQRKQLPTRGRFIVVKHAVLLKPDADVLFITGENSPATALDCLPLFRGRYAIVRGKSNPELPQGLLRVGRSKLHTTLSDDPNRVTGYDGGTSAINLAYLFGARTIVLLGYDMIGGHWFSRADGFKHYVPDPPMEHFQRHMGPLEGLAEDCKRKGVRVVNVSPISRVKAFERGRLEDWL